MFLDINEKWYEPKFTWLITLRRPAIFTLNILKIWRSALYEKKKNRYGYNLYGKWFILYIKEKVYACIHQKICINFSLLFTIS